MRIKTAYQLGMYSALMGLGLAKVAQIDDPALMDESAPQTPEANNPAEMLAQIFQQADVSEQAQTPDNKTSPHDPDGGSVKWGPKQRGTGGEALERIVPGLSMPDVSSV